MHTLMKKRKSPEQQVLVTFMSFFIRFSYPLITSLLVYQHLLTAELSNFLPGINKVHLNILSLLNLRDPTP